MGEVRADLSIDNANKSSDVQYILNLVDNKLTFEMTEDQDGAIIYYVAGYIAKGLLQQEKCKSCCQMISGGKEAPPVTFSRDATLSAKSAFLEKVNRGGLVRPSDIVFVYCLHAAKLYDIIFLDQTIKDTFLSRSNPRETFSKLLMLKMKENLETHHFFQLCCSGGNEFSKHFHQIGQVFGNCMMKNFVLEINDKLHQQWKRNTATANSCETASTRKIGKLSTVWIFAWLSLIIL